ncbi:MAG: NfeD family protein [Candidatus Jordarchaeales archaeon]
MVLAVEWWLLNIIGSLILLALGVILMLADAELGTGLVSLIGAVCAFMAVVILIPTQTPPQNQDFVILVRNVMLACSIVATGFFLFVSYKAYEAKRLRDKVGIDSIVGERGVAKTELKPKGVVNVKGELWSAVTESGEQVAEGEEVEVVGYEGITLIVRPVGRRTALKWKPS